MEAVIDKDRAAALLAEQVQADTLLLLTDVAAVLTEWPTAPCSRPIGRVSPMELRAYQFETGSMGPKLEAACQFVEKTGRIALSERWKTR